MIQRTPRSRRRPLSAREIALTVLFHVDTRKAFADLQLNQYFKESNLDSRDMALATEIVNGTLRWRARLDWELGAFVRSGLDDLSPWVLNTLRMGLYQIVFLDRVPPHAAVDESVKLAKRYANPGAAGLVNAVLRKALQPANRKEPSEVLSDPDRAMAMTWSHPEWLVRRWLKRYGEDETVALMQANNRTPALGLRVNALRGDRETLRRVLEAEGVVAEPTDYSRVGLRVDGNATVARLDTFRSGLFFVQDESETLVVELLDPLPGERILDLCAAPGGKTTHIQERRGDQGTVVAVDSQDNRLRRVQENVDRLGISGVEIMHGDGAEVTFDAPFDRVLVDAPCSGLGVLARRADARWRKSPANLDAMTGLQWPLLEAGGSHVKPGGVLVYSVCSNEPEEGAKQVRRFLDGHDDFELDPADTYLPGDTVESGMMRMLPHRHGTDGAFAARMRRRG